MPDPSKTPLDYGGPATRGSWLSRTADEMRLRPWQLVALLATACLIEAGFVALLFLVRD
jgi:hypothetical protein